MDKIRPWLALFAAASVPLAFYLTQRQQKSQARQLAETARERARSAGGSARETLGSLGETTRGAAGSVAGTVTGTAGKAASTVVERAGTVLAAAPVVGSRFRQDDGEPAGRSDDWREYGKVFRS